MPVWPKINVASGEKSAGGGVGAPVARDSSTSNVKANVST